MSWMMSLRVVAVSGKLWTWRGSEGEGQVVTKLTRHQDAHFEWIIGVLLYALMWFSVDTQVRSSYCE